jgi:uncharacterized Zn-binding protein involved in type VI secretion
MARDYRWRSSRASDRIARRPIAGRVRSTGDRHVMARSCPAPDTVALLPGRRRWRVDGDAAARSGPWCRLGGDAGGSTGTRRRVRARGVDWEATPAGRRGRGGALGPVVSTGRRRRRVDGDAAARSGPWCRLGGDAGGSTGTRQRARELGVDWEATLAGQERVIRSRPMYGRRTSGTVTDPSGRWYVSSRAATTRARARPDPLSVCTSSGFAPGSGR